MKKVPLWEDKYVNNIDQASDEVNDYYIYLKKRWLDKKYVKISNYEGENSSYYFYFIDENILTAIHKDKTVQNFKKIEDILKWYIEAYKNDYKRVCMYIMNYAISMAIYFEDEESIKFWKNYYLVNEMLWQKRPLKSLSDIDYYEKNHYMPVELFNNIFSYYSYLTPVGKHFSEEVFELAQEKLRKEFQQIGTNFLYRFSKIEKHTVQLAKGNFDGKTDIFTNRYRIIRDNSMKNELKIFIKEIENEVRVKKKLPKIGEGWISETILYLQMDLIFDKEYVLFHSSPDFLGRQHYDIFFPNRGIAIEYQGEQHNRPIDFFGGEEAYIENVKRDNRKKKISKSNNIDLIEVHPGYNLNVLVKKIEKKLGYKIENKDIERVLKESPILKDKAKKRKKELSLLNLSYEKKEVTVIDPKKIYEELEVRKDLSVEMFLEYVCFSLDKSKSLKLNHEMCIELILKGIELINTEWDYITVADLQKERQETINKENRLIKTIGHNYGEEYVIKNQMKIELTSWRDIDYFKSQYDIVSRTEYFTLSEELSKLRFSYEDNEYYFKTLNFKSKQQKYFEVFLFKAFLYFKRRKEYLDSIYIAEFAINKKIDARGKLTYSERIKELFYCIK